MHAFKGFLFVLFGLAIMITLFSLLMPSRVMMVRTTSISASPDTVFSAIRNLHAWTQWHPALQTTNQNWTVSQSSRGYAEASWSEKNEKQRLQVTADSGMVLQASLVRIHEKPLQYIITVNPSQTPGQSEVEWRIIQNLGWWPWDKFGGMVMDKMAGPGYEEALKGLKNYSEK